MPLHADRGNGRTETTVDRSRSGETSTLGGLTNGYLFASPFFYHLDGRDRRGIGWEFVHVCIDDASRLAFSQIMPDEKKESAATFLKAAVAYYQSLGITVARVMTDNGSCYKALTFRDACRDLGLKHIRTKPYTLKTNGKAERFIQTALREWAYAQPYPTSQHRRDALPAWLHRYNWHRPHSSL